MLVLLIFILEWVYGIIAWSDEANTLEEDILGRESVNPNEGILIDSLWTTASYVFGCYFVGRADERIFPTPWEIPNKFCLLTNGLVCETLDYLFVLINGKVGNFGGF